MSLIYGPLNGFLFFLGLALVVLKVIAFIDAAIRPASAYEAAGKQTKTFWLVILGLAVVMFSIGLLGLAGLIAAIVYLVDVRPAIRGLGGGRGGNERWRA